MFRLSSSFCLTFIYLMYANMVMWFCADVSMLSTCHRVMCLSEMALERQVLVDTSIKSLRYLSSRVSVWRHLAVRGISGWQCMFRRRRRRRRRRHYINYYLSTSSQVSHTSIVGFFHVSRFKNVWPSANCGHIECLGIWLRNATNWSFWRQRSIDRSMCCSVNFIAVLNVWILHKYNVESLWLCDCDVFLYEFTFVVGFKCRS